MKNRYIVAGILLTACTASMLNGCGKNQEEESYTVSIVYEADSKENGSGESKESAEGTKGAESSGTDMGSDIQETDGPSGADATGESSGAVLPSGFPEEPVVPVDDTEPTAAGVGMGANTVVVDNKDTEEVELRLDDEDILKLENMNFFVPLFESGAAHDEAFQGEILRYGFLDMVNGGEQDTLEDGSGNKAEGYKVAESVAAAYYQNLLGEELTIKPERPQNFGDEPPVYYADGYYYIGVLEIPSTGYMFHRAYQKGDSVFVAFYMFDDTDTYSDYVFEIEWADNDNGFIVKAHYYDQQSE